MATAPPAPISSAELLSKTGYDLSAHPAESMDWLNVLFAQVRNPSDRPRAWERTHSDELTQFRALVCRLSPAIGHRCSPTRVTRELARLSRTGSTRERASLGW